MSGDQDLGTMPRERSLDELRYRAAYWSGFLHSLLSIVALAAAFAGVIFLINHFPRG